MPSADGNTPDAPRQTDNLRAVSSGFQYVAGDSGYRCRGAAGRQRAQALGPRLGLDGAGRIWITSIVME